VGVKIQVNGQRIKIGNGAVLEPKLGSIVEVERWVAEELAQSGVGSMQDDVQLDRISLNRLRWLETSISADSLRPLPPSFYPRARRLIQTARASSPELLNDVDSTLREVLNARVRKLMRLAIAPSLPPDAHASLQPEEKLVYDIIHGCLNSWKEGVLGVGWK